jgi:hypothetical protein
MVKYFWELRNLRICPFLDRKKASTVLKMPNPSNRILRLKRIEAIYRGDAEFLW